MAADDLVALFDLAQAGEDRFTGLSPNNGWRRVFGGQVLAQALVAAERTVVGPARFRMKGMLDATSPIEFRPTDLKRYAPDAPPQTRQNVGLRPA